MFLWNILKATIKFFGLLYLGVLGFLVLLVVLTNILVWAMSQ